MAFFFDGWWKYLNFCVKNDLSLAQLLIDRYWQSKAYYSSIKNIGRTLISI